MSPHPTDAPVRSAPIAAAALLGLAALATSAGCAGETTEETTVQEGAVVEFQDQFGTAGRLTVVRDREGNLGMMLAEPIADAPPNFRSDLIGKPLAEIYEALHPGKQASPKLHALSAELSKAQADRPSPDRPAFDQSADKDLTSFNATVCRDLPGDNLAWYWKKIRCGFQPVPGAPPAAYDYFTGDIAAGWNETASSAFHDNSNSSWRPVIPPYTYYWTQWNMRYEGAVIEMRPYDPYAHPTGYYGVTVHHKTSNFRYL